MGLGSVYVRFTTSCCYGKQQKSYKIHSIFTVVVTGNPIYVFWNTGLILVSSHIKTSKITYIIGKKTV